MIPVNFADQLQVLTIVGTKTETSSNTGTTAVNLNLYEGEIAFILNSAHGSGNADNTMAGKLQDSADGSTGWADITGGGFTTVDGTNDSVQKVSLKKDDIRQYVRWVSTVAGTSPSYRFGVVAGVMKKYQD